MSMQLCAYGSSIRLASLSPNHIISGLMKGRARVRKKPSDSLVSACPTDNTLAQTDGSLAVFKNTSRVQI